MVDKTNVSVSFSAPDRSLLARLVRALEDLNSTDIVRWTKTLEDGTIVKGQTDVSSDSEHIDNEGLW